MGLFNHTEPPITTDEKMHRQTALKETTVEELTELRKLPKFSPFQIFLHIVLFIIFGTPKIVLGLCFALIAGPLFVLIVTIWKLFGRPESWRLPIKKTWAALARVFLFFIGFARINYHGQLDPEAKFLVANHTCFFDGWIFLPFHPRPLGKKEILKVPIIREMNEIYQGIPVDRSKSTGVANQLIQIAQDPKSPIISIMPEGATTNGDYMLRFHLGAFLSDLPVQLAATRYTLWFTSRKLSYVHYFQNVTYHWIVFLGIPFITVDIKFLKTISLKTDGNNDPRQLADEASLAIANELGIPVLNLTSSSIYKKEDKKGESKQKTE